ncbi:hypothetical protein GCM10010176_082620 [Nonomuraea spiralis]|nr:hypothetical protein GCM10010176_082620 [Nonomuraea spiralis]
MIQAETDDDGEYEDQVIVGAGYGQVDWEDGYGAEAAASGHAASFEVTLTRLVSRRSARVRVHRRNVGPRAEEPPRGPFPPNRQ